MDRTIERLSMIVLVIGGTRSGKSELAERIAADAGEPVTVIVPALPTEDAELNERIAAHRERRPSSWSTVECGPELARALAEAAGTVLVDSLGTWVAACPDFECDIDALVRALDHRSGATVVVTEEVGLSVHPPTDVGRHFTDVLGDVNRSVAAVADDMLLVVAGRALSFGAGTP